MNLKNSFINALVGNKIRTSKIHKFKLYKNNHMTNITFISTIALLFKEMKNSRALTRKA